MQLVQLQAKHSNLTVVGATTAGAGSLADFRAKTKAAFPILHGMDAATSKAYEIGGYPSIRVIDAHGHVVGSDMAALEQALAN